MQTQRHQLRVAEYTCIILMPRLEIGALSSQFVSQNLHFEPRENIEIHSIVLASTFKRICRSKYFYFTLAAPRFRTLAC